MRVTKEKAAFSWLAGLSVKKSVKRVNILKGSYHEFNQDMRRNLHSSMGKED